MRGVPQPRNLPRAGAGLALAVLLQLGLWYALLRPHAAQRDGGSPERTALFELRLLPLPRPAPQPTLDARAPPAATRATLRPALAADAGAVAMPAEAPARSDLSSDTSASAASLDLDALKQRARRHSDFGAAPHTLPQSPPPLSQQEKLGKEIAKAARPKCDNDYTPSIGSVSFKGLLKIPFLVKGAVGDSGCKW